MKIKRKMNRRIMAAKLSEPSMDNLLNTIKSWTRMINRYYSEGKDYPEALISDLKASMNAVLKSYGADINAACGKKAVKAAVEDTYMFSELLGDKDAYIQEWSTDYEGTPNTSWDNIFDNAVEMFERYCDDEASADSDGRTIKDRFNAGVLTDRDIAGEFRDWVLFEDLNEYDF